MYVRLLWDYQAPMTGASGRGRGWGQFPHSYFISAGFR